MSHTKRWIALAMIGEEDCNHTSISEIQTGESILDAKERIIFSRHGWKCKPDEVDPEDREWENGRWDTFIFTIESEVAKLNNIDLPSYDDSYSLFTSEAMHSVYAAFADECIIGEH